MQLIDICEYIIDCEHKTAPIAKKGIPCVRTTDILNGRINFDNANKVEDDIYKQWTKRLEPKPYDIILAREAPVGEVGIIPEGQKACLGQRTVLIRAKKDLVNPYYLLYLFVSPILKNEMLMRVSGTTVEHLNMKDIRSIEISDLPPLGEQKAIASILSNFDAKIDLLRRQNQTLENTAQALFRRWFIDFEFPDENGKPYKSSGGKMVESEWGEIPDGWKITPLSEVTDLIKPGTNCQPKRIERGGVPFLNGRNIVDNVINCDDISYISNEDYLKIHQKWTPSENDLLITRIGTLGNVGLIRKSDLPIGVHYNIIVIRPKLEILSHELLYFFLKSGLLKEQFRAMKKQTVQEFMVIDDVCSIIWFLPKKESLRQLETAFKSVLRKILSNKFQIQTLTKTRDTLLPKLMSGQIRVKGL
jgi:type I restriction enzyme, S subunit